MKAIYAFETNEDGSVLNSIATATYDDEKSKEEAIEFINNSICNYDLSGLLIIDGEKLYCQRQTSLIVNSQ